MSMKIVISDMMNDYICITRLDIDGMQEDSFDIHSGDRDEIAEYLSDHSAYEVEDETSAQIYDDLNLGLI